MWFYKSLDITRLSPMSFKCRSTQPWILTIISSALPVTAHTDKVFCVGVKEVEIRNCVCDAHTKSSNTQMKVGVAMQWADGEGERKCLRGPLVHDSGERHRRGWYHLSATAAAMGTRKLPQAVAASSPISVFNRLMTHSIASRPWNTEWVFITWCAVTGQQLPEVVPQRSLDLKEGFLGWLTLPALTEMVLAIKLSR